MARFSFASLLALGFAATLIIGCVQPTDTRQPTPRVTTPANGPQTRAPNLPAMPETTPAETAARAPELETTMKPGGPTDNPTPKVPKTQTQQTVGNVTITTKMSNSHVLMPGDGTVHMEVTLEALKNDGAARLPMNLALVIDRSGSMRGEKMRDSLKAARHLIEQLTEKDHIAIISYSDDVRVDLPSAPADSETRELAMEAINRIKAGGSTNLSGGLFRGQDEVRRNLRTGQVNRVILMSDGLANRGITDNKQLSMQAQKHAQEGISVTTMGVGVDYNEDLMTSVADHASGNYYFIEKSSQIATVFKRELDKMFSTVAQATKVELTIEDGVDLAQIFGYTFTRQGDVVTIPLAEMFGGQKRSILMAFKVPTVRAGTLRVAEVKLQYLDISSEGEQREAKVVSQVTVTSDKTLVEKNHDKTVEERVGEVEVANAVNQAANLLRDGKNDEAQQVLQQVRTSNMARMGAMGGSARLQAQEEALDQLEGDFEKAADEPSAAPAMIKASKAQSHKLVR